MKKDKMLIATLFMAASLGLLIPNGNAIADDCERKVCRISTGDCVTATVAKKCNMSQGGSQCVGASDCSVPGEG